jgi:hypothetical protein
MAQGSAQGGGDPALAGDLGFERGQAQLSAIQCKRTLSGEDAPDRHKAVRLWPASAWIRSSRAASASE